MNEKAYKAMTLAGSANIAIGIVIAVVGITAGVISIVSGARLMKEAKGLIFEKVSTDGVLDIWIQSEIEESVFSEKFYLYYILFLLYIFCFFLTGTDVLERCRNIIIILCCFRRLRDSGNIVIRLVSLQCLRTCLEM